MRTVFIPENFNIEKHLTTYPQQITSFKKDRLLKIIGLISELPIQIKDLQLKDGFVLISSRIFQSIAHNYVEYIDYLTETGVIEVNRQYIVGEKPRGYRFHAYYNSKLREVELKSEKQDISTVTKKQDWGDILRRNKAKFLLKWIFNGNLNIDSIRAIEFLQKEYQSAYIETPKEALTKYNSGIMSISRIRNLDLFAHLDNTSFRLHSNFTNLKKGLRNFITYNNQVLVSIDLKNSQPYLSTLLLQKGFYEPYSVLNLSKLKIPILNWYRIRKIKEGLIIILERIEKNPSILDSEKYQKLVLSGQFYEHFVKVIKESTGETRTRDNVKIEILRAFFGKHELDGGGVTLVKKLFASEFPIMYEIFGILKKKDKNVLAIILQRIESYIIIDIICKRISREHPNIPLITIHDSIATTEENYEVVEAYMKKLLTELVGHPPKLKIERWLPEI